MKRGPILLLLCHCAASCHCVALDVNGRCYTWGRNEVHKITTSLVVVLFLDSFTDTGLCSAERAARTWRYHPA